MTDPTYLFPTLASAVQARRHASPHLADVAVFSFDTDRAVQHALEHACSSENILFLPIEGAQLGGAPAMLARLFLTKLVPSDYRQFLYIDGDTQIRDSLDPLIEYAVPPGKFLAANDPMTFAFTGRGSHDRQVAAHFSSVGLNRAECGTYFNSGVLRINRDGWDVIENAALDLYRRSDETSKFPDQDVLNFVARGHHIPMSLAWNFPIFMLNARVETKIAPRIYHFMSKPKPWEGTFPPWTFEAQRPYLELVRKYPKLIDFSVKMPGPKRVRYQAQQRYKQLIETVSWGFSTRRDKILAYERTIAALCVSGSAVLDAKAVG
jgi:hypothetical protein